MENKHIFSIRRNEKGIMELVEYSQYALPFMSPTEIAVYPFEEDHKEVAWLRYKVKQLEDELLKMQQKYEPLPLNLNEIFN